MDRPMMLRRRHRLNMQSAEAMTRDNLAGTA
jgi:hypothetical protein